MDETSIVAEGTYTESGKHHHSQQYWYPPLYRTNWEHLYPSNSPISVPEDFVPPRHDFTRATATQPDYVPSSPAILKQKVDDGYIWKLEKTDILTGRGAPTKFHSGNQWFQDIISQYQTSYICSKRSDKPRIAKEVQDLIRSRGGRFLKRHHRAAGRAAWVEINEQQAYEKVCQSLRDGAPELRRQMFAYSSKKKQKDHHSSKKQDDKDIYQEEYNKENYAPIPCW